MFKTARKAAIGALVAGAAFALGAAAADEGTKAGLARDLLHNVPVFYVANEDGSPTRTAGAGTVTYYLTRAQASIAVGMARADLIREGRDEAIHVELTNLGDAARRSEPHTFQKPLSRMDASAAFDGVPLFLVRDRDGTPFTLRDDGGQKRVYFYLSERDAQAFIGRVMIQTNRRASDMRLSMVGLDSVVNSIMTSSDPLVQNWAIWPSAETRLDADNLKNEALLDPRRRPE